MILKLEDPENASLTTAMTDSTESWTQYTHEAKWEVNRVIFIRVSTIFIANLVFFIYLFLA